MDGIEVVLLCQLCQLKLACGSAVFSVNTHLQILLAAVGQHFSEQLGKFGGVLGLFQTGFIPVVTDFRITFSIGNARHGQIHANL